ncbi:MAG: GGDEF domain-containing protein [Myxococcota bacterium]
MSVFRARLVGYGLFALVTVLDAIFARGLSLGVLHFPGLLVLARWGRPSEAWALAALATAELWVLGPLGDPLSFGAAFPPLVEHVTEVIAAAVSYFAVVAVLLQGRRIATLSAEVARDPLTRLGNRRALAEHLRKMEARGAPVAVFVVDIDHFKEVNDRWGHAAGDLVLQELARRLVAALRHNDAIARTGGEEFVAVVDEVDAVRAEALAERIRRRIADEPFTVDGGTLDVTISIGGAVGEPGEPLIARADAALFEAKEAGRNRVVFAR